METLETSPIVDVWGKSIVYVAEYWRCTCFELNDWMCCVFKSTRLDVAVSYPFFVGVSMFAEHGGLLALYLFPEWAKVNPGVSYSYLQYKSTIFNVYNEAVIHTKLRRDCSKAVLSLSVYSQQSLQHWCCVVRCCLSHSHQLSFTTHREHERQWVGVTWLSSICVMVRCTLKDNDRI